MKIDNDLVGKAIARLREMRGLTQSQLNDLVGMSTIQHIEHGRNAVSLTCLNKIAGALEIPAACIVLLGSQIDKDDRVLSSLQSLLEKTIRLDADAKPKKLRRKTPSVKTVRRGKQGMAQSARKSTKKEKALA